MLSDGESSSIGLVRSAVNYRTILETPSSPPPCSAAAANPPTKLLAANGEFEDEFFLVRWWCSPWRNRKGILIPIFLLVVFTASFSWDSSEDGGRVRVRPLWWKKTNRSKKGDVDGGKWTIQDDNTEPSTPPVWVWDHYLYNPQNSTTDNGAANPRLATSSDNRNLLIAQVVSAPPRNAKHPPFKRHNKDDANRAAAAALLLTQEELAEISSRPNRAYARQWGRNYLRYTSPLAAAAADDKNDDRNRNMQCHGAGVDHVVVLNTILDRQPPREHVPSDKQGVEDNEDVSSSSPPPSWLPSYDALVLLPPDAIITDLDFDLLTMIPDDKLLATTTTTTSVVVDSSNRAGKQEQQQQLRQQNEGIVFWNLRHPLARTVVKRLWSEIVLAARVKDDEQQKQQEQNDDHPSEFVCNGETNYIQWLLEEILPSLLLKDGEQQEGMGEKNLQLLVGRLEETADGFVFAAAEQASSSSQVQVDATMGNGAASGGGYCLKCFPQRRRQGDGTGGPTIHRNHHQQHPDDAARVTLQTTADAVCYRYYPKCEVF